MKGRAEKDLYKRVRLSWGTWLTWVLEAEGRASVVIVEHVGGEGSLELISLSVLDNLLFGLLFLFLLSAFAWAAVARSSCNARFMLLCSLVFVASAASRLSLFYKIR